MDLIFKGLSKVYSIKVLTIIISLVVLLPALFMALVRGDVFSKGPVLALAGDEKQNNPGDQNCPSGKIKKIVDSTVVCVTQEQSQSQKQEQNNNQNQNVNANSNAQGGSSSSTSNSEANVNINSNWTPTPTPTATPTPTPTPEVQIRYVYDDYGRKVLGSQKTYVPVQTKGGTPQITTQVQASNIKELPRTGLPLAGLGLAALLPGGWVMRKIGKKSTEDTANSIWNEKQLGK